MSIPAFARCQRLTPIVALAFGLALTASAAEYAAETFPTSKGDLKITPINHATLMLQFDGKVIVVDPTKDGDFSALPKADLVLITDVHPDHMDKEALAKVKKESTVIASSHDVVFAIPEAQMISNGETKTIAGIQVEAVPMYNLQRGPAVGAMWHTKGRGNGYILTLGGKRVYISGDTEAIPEMKGLRNIDIAFVCMNLPYTMPPSEAAEAVKEFKPKIVYPYHFKGSDPQEFAAALKDVKGVEVRIRKWY